MMNYKRTALLFIIAFVLVLAFSVTAFAAMAKRPPVHLPPLPLLYFSQEKTMRESNYVTILSESTVVGENGLKAIPIVDTDTPDKEMLGCIHLLKNTYVKNSTKEFVRMLSDSTSILRNTLEEF